MADIKQTVITKLQHEDPVINRIQDQTARAFNQLQSQVAGLQDPGIYVWNGYQNVASGNWQTTSATFADFSSATTVTVTELVNEGFITPVTIAGPKAGLTVTFPVVGLYLITAMVNFNSSALSTHAIELVDGSGAVICSGATFSADTGYWSTPTLVGVYKVTTVGAYDLKLKGNTNGGTVTVANGNGNAISWAIHKIN